MTMMLSALSVVYINNEETIENGEAAMANAYQVFSTDGSGGFDTLLLSFANSFVRPCSTLPLLNCARNASAALTGTTVCAPSCSGMASSCPTTSQSLALVSALTSRETSTTVDRRVFSCLGRSEKP